jgi:hypothetical protein
MLTVNVKLKAESKPTIEVLTQAGIRSVMVTGADLLVLFPPLLHSLPHSPFFLFSLSLHVLLIAFCLQVTMR